MNENARKWVEALRSGEYEQAKGALRDGDGYCCLGVARDLYAKDTGDGWWACVGTFAAGRDRATTTLPRAVTEWLGLKYETGNYGHLSDRNALTAQNDGGATFTDIADIIEAEPEGLFA